VVLTGRAAVKCALKHDLDVVLMDVRMTKRVSKSPPQYMDEEQ